MLPYVIIYNPSLHSYLIQDTITGTYHSNAYKTLSKAQRVLDAICKGYARYIPAPY